MCPHGRKSVSRLASEQTRHSSAVGSEASEVVDVISVDDVDVVGAHEVDATEAAAVPLATALNGLVSPSGVLSEPSPLPSFRQVVKVLQRFGSGHKSRGV